jgi:hypothetical protein
VVVGGGGPGGLFTQLWMKQTGERPGICAADWVISTFTGVRLHALTAGGGPA